MTPLGYLLAALVAVLVLGRPFMGTWARRRAPRGTWTSRQRSHRWAAVTSGLALAIAVLVVTLG